MRELAQGVAAVIDDIDRLNSMQQAAYVDGLRARPFSAGER